MHNISHSDETKHVEFLRPMGGAKSVETNRALICNAAMPSRRKTDEDAARVLSVLNLAPRPSLAVSLLPCLFYSRFHEP